MPIMCEKAVRWDTEAAFGSDMHGRMMWMVRALIYKGMPTSGVDTLTAAV